MPTCPRRIALQTALALCIAPALAMSAVSCGPLVAAGALGAVAGGGGGGGSDGASPRLEFSDPVRLETDAEVISVKICDVNLDGRPDVLAGTRINGGPEPNELLTVFVNTTSTSDGGITLAARSDFASSEDPFALVTTDLDLDGRIDVVGRGLGAIMIYRNRTASGGAPDFAEELTIGGQTRGVAVADLDNDQRPDIIAALPASRLVVYRNLTPPGSPAIILSSAEELRAALGNADGGVRVLPLDIDRDGRMDLVVSGAIENFGPHGLSVFMNRTVPGGALTFRMTPYAFDLDWLAAADLDGNGAVDLVFRDGTLGQSHTLINETPAGGSGPIFRVRIIDHVVSPAPIEPGTDVDGDGRPDIYDQGLVGFQLNATPPGDEPVLTPAVVGPLSAPPGDGNLLISAGDLDLDGRPDLVFQSYGEGFVTLNRTRSFGRRSLRFAPPSVVAGGSLGERRRVAVADLNHDSALDLINSHDLSGSVYVFGNRTGQTDDSFHVEQAAVVFAGGTITAVLAPDLDANGLPEIAVALDDGRVVVFRNATPPGTAGAMTFDAPLALAAGAGAAALASADLNLDGRPDLACASTRSAGLTILMNATAPGGPISFTAQALATAGLAPDALVIRDLDRDGRPDLALLDSVGGRLAIALNDTPPGAATLSFAPLDEVDLPPDVLRPALASLDLDRDGALDLVLLSDGATSGGGALLVVPNATAPGASAFSAGAIERTDLVAAFGGAGAAPLCVAVGDMNADGLPDLVVGTLGGAHLFLSGHGLSPLATLLGSGSVDHVEIADLDRDRRPDVVTWSLRGRSLAVHLQQR